MCATVQTARTIATKLFFTFEGVPQRAVTLLLTFQRSKVNQ